MELKKINYCTFAIKEISAKLILLANYKVFIKVDYLRNSFFLFLDWAGSGHICET